MIHKFVAHSLFHRWSFVEEDFAYFRKQGNKVAAAVADGITRDLITGEAVSREGLFNVIKSIVLHQRPTHARIVAEKSCRTFVNPENYRYYFSDNFSEEEIRRRFRAINLEAKKHNDRFCSNPNYLENDLAGCVASGFLARGRDLFYGFITDCGVVVHNKKGELVFETPDEGPGSKGSISDEVARKYGFGFKDAEGRKIIRSSYRNNPNNPLAYGALTGEEKAMDYVRTKYHELEDGSLVMLYTDGLEKFLYDGVFIDKLKEGIEKRDFSELERYCRKRVKSEGTALIYVPEF